MVHGGVHDGARSLVLPSATIFVPRTASASASGARALERLGEHRAERWVGMTGERRRDVVGHDPAEDRGFVLRRLDYARHRDDDALLREDGDALAFPANRDVCAPPAAVVDRPPIP